MSQSSTSRTDSVSQHTHSNRSSSTTNSMLHCRLRSVLMRGCLLFAVGVIFALVLNLLQIQRNVTKFSSDLVDNLFKSAWWVPPSCGTAAAVIGLLHPMFDDMLGESTKRQQEWANVMKIIAVFIGINYASAVSLFYMFFGTLVGLLYPTLDKALDEPHHLHREWSSVMRNIAFFVGINHACAKIEYSNNLQLSLTLAAMSIGLWWLFDRSRSGFGLGVSIAVIATLVTQLLVYYGVYMYTEPDFLYVRSWLPCVFFSGGVTMGNIGRQLAMYDYREKEHHD